MCAREPTLEQEDVVQTVAALYEAAIDPRRWGAALQGLADLAGAASAICFVHDASSNRLLEAHRVGGFTTDWLKRYAEHYLPLDPARQVLERLPSGTMRPMHHFLSDRMVASSEYFNDFYLPSGHRYSCGGVQVAEGQRGILAVHRPPAAATYDDDTVNKLQRVLDHLPGVLRMRALTGHTSCTSAALAALPRPVFVLDRTLAVHYANPAAEALLRRDQTLSSRHGRLDADDAHLARELARRVAAACRNPPVVDLAPLYGLDASGRARLELQVAPLHERLEMPWRAEPLALLSARSTFRLEDWRQAAPRPFELTQAEFRLVGGLVAGQTPDEYALHQGVAMSTVRSQISAVLRKTGLRKASEIVALFAPLEILVSQAPADGPAQGAPRRPSARRPYGSGSATDRK